MKELHFTKMEDLYSLTSEMLLKNKGNTLMKKYNNSVAQLVTGTFPQHDWQFWRFKTYQKHMWDDKVICARYMDWLGDRLGYKKKEDWYSATTRNFTENSGGPLLKKYGSSPASVIMSVYHSHPWLPWKFTIKKNTIVLKDELLPDFIKYVAGLLRVETVHDWYNISKNKIPDSISSIVRANGGLGHILKKVFPAHDWDMKLLAKTMHKIAQKEGQSTMAKIVSALFPASDVIEEFIHPTVISPTTKQPLTLDIYVPAYRLGFEFQGKQHYTPKNGNSLFASLRLLESDVEKRKLCQLAGIHVTEVPYWWDGNKESLERLIKSQHVNYDKSKV
eukprot:Phypoly_transcript_12971.p1 GENE.Phypoly_transcript_12971~~Phypoly_transcript_12971.p1  ORF type:complete len:364 (+),score=48.65 Phypoly_transcript_12971:95-1093(+)